MLIKIFSIALGIINLIFGIFFCLTAIFGTTIAIFGLLGLEEFDLPFLIISILIAVIGYVNIWVFTKLIAQKKRKRAFFVLGTLIPVLEVLLIYFILNGVVEVLMRIV